jgi:hypothetical protein
VNKKCTIREKPNGMGSFAMSIGEQSALLGHHVHDQAAQQSSFF